ncbi:hypothetical protein C9374_003949 [Naegleria lovaniensis]|uniref:Uncharacterized protein n=1 Tax=Naegleria lovaniensis TaxID=51637 RepID=A0AA88H3Z6_NAELO|nr:uncharacterized protein C9374_003949 [Naegleria lovaniensis]KAG2394185.1 hypothetical protein C9374_003949 [Naegleria lovaniensis]
MRQGILSTILTIFCLITLLLSFHRPTQTLFIQAYTCGGFASSDFSHVCSGRGFCSNYETCTCLDLSASNSLTSGTILYPGNSLISSNGINQLIMQQDGNLVLYDTLYGVANWASGTFNPTKGFSYQLRLYNDGSLAVIDPYELIVKTVAGSCNGGVGPFRFVVGNDRDLVVYDSLMQVCWKTDIRDTARSVLGVKYKGRLCENAICFGKDNSDTHVCGGFGRCVAPDTCQCPPGHTGATCQQYSCFGISSTSSQVCSNGHGVCSANNRCTCLSGYTGTECQTFTCFGIAATDSSICSGHGKCTNKDTCQCESGWSGSNCNNATTKCFGIPFNDPSVCNGRGTCIANDVCACQGYSGMECQVPTCFSRNSTDPFVCSGHGNCVKADTCMCEKGYGGAMCQYVKCNDTLSSDSSQVCHGHGQCVQVDTCQCESSYGGPYCSIPQCGWSKNNPSNMKFGAPTPFIHSRWVQMHPLQPSILRFEVSFAKHPETNFKHYLFIGESNFQAHSLLNCSVNGPYPITLNPYPYRSDLCWKNYSSVELSLNDFLKNEHVQKEFIGNEGEYLKLQMPLKMVYLDENGSSSNFGLCSSFEFETNQVLYVKRIAWVDSGFTESEEGPRNFKATLYQQQLTTRNGVLKVQMILQTIDATMVNFSFYNTSSSLYNFTLTNISLWYQNGNANYYLIQMSSGVAVQDFRANIFLVGSFKKNRVLDQVQVYFPVTIDYIIATPPSSYNITLQVQMGLADSSWRPRTKFMANERAVVTVWSPSATLLVNDHLIVKKAYLCCFKEFTPTLQGSSNGCTQYNPSTMDVWKEIISDGESNVYSSELETSLHPYPYTNTLFGFSFKLLSSIFPERYSNTSSSCFVQSKVGVRPIANSRKLSDATSELADDSVDTFSLFVVDFSNMIIPKTLSASVSVFSFYGVGLLICVVSAMATVL